MEATLSLVRECWCHFGLERKIVDGAVSIHHHVSIKSGPTDVSISVNCHSIAITSYAETSPKPLAKQSVEMASSVSTYSRLPKNGEGDVRSWFFVDIVQVEGAISERYGFASRGRHAIFPHAVRLLDALPTDLDSLIYIASHGDLIQAVGVNAKAGREHYYCYGKFEGRKIHFDPDRYLRLNPDIRNQIHNQRAACEHYIAQGFANGRPTH